MDNAAIHKTRSVLAAAREMGAEIIFNAPYSSEFHCIEEVFSLIKRSYRQKIIEEDFRITEASHRSIINNCVNLVQQKAIYKCHERQMKKMKEFLSIT